jgi:hypothetical protein
VWSTPEPGTSDISDSVEDPVRVGYLADFKDETSRLLLSGILMHHDRYLPATHTDFTTGVTD